MKRLNGPLELFFAAFLLTLFLATVPQASAQTCVQPPSGLIGRWPGDGNTKDLSARQNNGTVVGGVTYLPGMVGQAFHFDGATGSVNIPNTDLYLDLGAQLTIDFWMKADQDNPMSGDYGHWQGLATTEWYGFEVDRIGGSNVDFFIHPNGGWILTSWAPGGLLLAPGEWYHIAGAYDGNSSTYYVNGQLVHQFFVIGSNPSMSQTGFLSVGSELGRTQFPGVPDTRWFKGLIDEVELYNRALSPEEIQAIFDAGSAGKCKVTTVQIDIKPGSDPNSINLSSAGVVPVAILSSSTFDATTVNPETVTLAGARVKMVGKSARYLCHAEDVNGDGRLDLVCQVNTAQFMIEAGDSMAVLEATTFDGHLIRGEDTIRIVPN